jgi:hypothetical protein
MTAHEVLAELVAAQDAFRALVASREGEQADMDAIVKRYQAAWVSAREVLKPKPEEDAFPRCTYRLRAQGKAYPRTCQECGLGPCRAKDPTK